MEIYLLNFIVSDTKICACTIKETSWRIINNKFLNLNYECFFFNEQVLTVRNNDVKKCKD